ncbi:MarR family winged helix-turn-helix transcriptional regulator [Hyphomonas sp.]|uniref:MarR family winged helix-turn-helix transcriptional regulator n=1 Tax=Hyphomonas sp. TaxID=87 RepID=UPI003565302F
MNSSTITEQLIHLGRIASGDGLVEGLTPGQWAILRYFAHANRFSQTPSAFAAFHGITRGTASQAIKSLVTQGYLHQARSKADGRSVRLGLTNKARAIFINDPIEVLVEAMEALPPGVRGDFSSILQRMLGRVALATGKPHFGVCESCAHFADGGGGCEEGRPTHLCTFQNEPLMEEDLDGLCIDFTPEKPGPKVGTGLR